MDKDVLVELIRIAPTFIGMAIVLIGLLIYRRPIVDLFARIGKVSAFGVEAEFAEAREQLIGAQQSYDANWDETKVRAVIERADRIRERLDTARVLWVDDHFLANANVFRFLNAYGMMIDSARTTDEALTALRWAGGAYEVVVSDMVRDGDPQAGITLLRRLDAEKITKPVLLFVAKLTPELGTPPGATAITDDPIKLIHSILNVIESEPPPTLS